MVRKNNGNRVAVGTAGNQVAGVMDDSASPYCLHSEDHPGLILVSNPLTGSNFNSWSRAITTALIAKNKLSFVDGSISPPAIGDQLYGAWRRCNSMVISWLLNVVDREIANSLLSFETAAEIWCDLHERFSQGNAPRIYQIKQQMMALQQGALDINTYYTKLKVLWDELRGFQPLPICNCGGMRTWSEFQQSDYVFQFLMGLNDSYAQMRAQILLMEPLPPISKVFSLVIQEERQRTISNAMPVGANTFDSSESVSMANAITQGKNRNDKEKPSCAHCGRLYHTIDTCYRLHGFPPGYGRGKSGAQTKKFGGSSGTQFKAKGQVNQAMSTEMPMSELTGIEALSADQCQQLISLLSAQLKHGSTISVDQPQASISSFGGDLKSVIVQKTGLKPETHKLLFRGKEKDDDESLQTAGVKDNCKVLHMEDMACKQKDPEEEVKETSVVSRGGGAVAGVREEVDKLADQVAALQAVVDSGMKVDNKDIHYLTEMLMRQLIKLDGIEAEGEGRVQRKMEVRRVQSFVETMDIIKSRNLNPFSKW